MRIALLTTFYPPYNFGGDGIFVQRLAETLARAGHDIHVIHNIDAYMRAAPAPMQLTDQPVQPGITLHRLTSGQGAVLDLLLMHQLGQPVLLRRELHALLHDGAFDVLHFHNVSLLGGPGILKSENAIKLCTLHDYWFVCAMHVLWRYDREACTRRTCLSCTLHGKRPPQIWRTNGGLERTVRHVDMFIGASQFVCDKHHEQGFSGKLTHIPHFLPDNYLALQAIPIDLPTRPFFLFAGRLEKIKGVQNLIEAFRSYDGADLVIAGSGMYESDLRAQAADLPHVHFVGSCSQTQLIGLYEHAIAAVIPSICYETFGWITLEAFARRTPVIVSDYGALPEIAGEGGLVFHDAEELIAHLQTLQTQPELRRALGEAGHRLLHERYTEAHHLEAYFALIDRVRAARAA